jgi:hypothetical protein
MSDDQDGDKHQQELGPDPDGKQAHKPSFTLVAQLSDTHQ